MDIRLDRLRDYHTEIEDKLRKDVQDLARRLEKGEFTTDDPELNASFFRIEYVLGNIHRYTMLIACCTFLEECLEMTAQRLVPETDQKLKKLQGSVVHKNLCVLAKHAGIDLSRVNNAIEKCRGLILLRNCVTHAWGRVERANNPEAVKAAAGRVESVQIPRDGILIFGDQVIGPAIYCAKHIAKHVLNEIYHGKCR